MEDEEFSKKFKDHMRKHGYPVPDDYESANTLRRAHDFLLDAFSTKRSLSARTRAAIIWGVVTVLTMDAMETAVKYVKDLVN